jgi:hypothetical protein
VRIVFLLVLVYVRFLPSQLAAGRGAEERPERRLWALPAVASFLEEVGEQEGRSTARRALLRNSCGRRG